VARIVKEHTVRRNEILDAAQRLMQAKGYERMAIQDILDELQIAKGTFYHYFDSKQALLEAMLARMHDGVEQLLIPIVRDPDLPALDKLVRVYTVINRWKTARKPFFIELLRVWYADDNAIVRQKVFATGIKRVAPLLAEIIHQGVREGVFTTSYPEEVGRVILVLGWELADTLAESLLSPGLGGGDPRRMKRSVAAYTDAIERVLGAPSGSIQLVDRETLEAWFLSSRETA
jgi:AcrR family transcriptional regulator